MKIEKLMKLVAAYDELRCAADHPRPLTPDYPVCSHDVDGCECDGARADREWQAESERLHFEAWRIEPAADLQERAKRLLSDRGRVGAHARNTYALARAALCGGSISLRLYGEEIEIAGGRRVA